MPGLNTTIEHPDYFYDRRDHALLPHLFMFLQFGERFAALIGGYNSVQLSFSVTAIVGLLVCLVLC